MIFKRYAVYFTAPEGPLADFGASWLGWDLATGRDVPHPDIGALDIPVTEITATPRKYGFHATMKPPFRLADAYSFDALKEATAHICKELDAVTLDGLALSRIGRFLALTPIGNETALNALAASVVRAFDPFRAPASDAELARRRAAGLAPSQDENLTQWGYPYVMQDFHFHMTLSGKLGKAHIETVQAKLEGAIAPFLPVPFALNTLTLAGEAEDGRFYAIERFPLRGNETP